MFVVADDCETNAPRDLLPIRHHEGHVLFLPLHADFFERGFGNPSEFASSVNEHLGHNDGLAAVNNILDLAPDEKCSHTFLLSTWDVRRCFIRKSSAHQLS